MLALLVAAFVYPAAEIELVIDKIDGNAVKLKPLYAAVLPAPTEVYIKIEQMLDLIGIFILYAAVIGRDNPCIDAESFQRFWQRSDDIGKTARL